MVYSSGLDITPFFIQRKRDHQLHQLLQRHLSEIRQPTASQDVQKAHLRGLQKQQSAAGLPNARRAPHAVQIFFSPGDFFWLLDIYIYEWAMQSGTFAILNQDFSVWAQEEDTHW